MLFIHGVDGRERYPFHPDLGAGPPRLTMRGIERLELMFLERLGRSCVVSVDRGASYFLFVRQVVTVSLPVLAKYWSYRRGMRVPFVLSQI